jgi:cytochrome P450
MVKLIKQTVLDRFSQLQAKGDKNEVDIVFYTQQIQAHIIMNVMCGPGQSTKLLPYVAAGMKNEEHELADYLDKLFWDLLERVKVNPLVTIIPWLMTKQITECDRRFWINCKTLRDFLRVIIEKAQTNPDPEAVDVISMLAADKLYSKNVDDIIDDVIVMFIAGSKTVQATTTNFLCHMLHRPDLKEKVGLELDPFLEKCKDNFMDLMTTDAIEDLEYLRNAYYEVLRYDTPIPSGSTATFSRDINIKGINFKKGEAIFIALAEMHRNPKEWVEPDVFNPDRFDPSSTWFKRPDGTNRNSMCFNPFLGGKRICLGKTFAETTLKLTLPLYWHHFDFEFVNEADKTTIPHLEVGTIACPTISMYFTTKNKVN